MKRRDFLKFLGLSAASVSIGGCDFGGPGLAKSKKMPNIVIILSDDLGYAELSCQGATQLSTPNIDSLARDGIRCTNAYTSGPICAPTRAGLMTGRYQNRFGYETFTHPAKRQREDDIGVPTDEIFFSQIFQKAGYKTGIIGKWHLGYNEKYRPNNRGFDEFFGFLAGGHDYYLWNSGYHGPIYRNSEKQKQPPKGREY
ncbi:MAG: sulfatase-like hydrolase/transferase, partial [Planctomycetota bacterium]